MNWSGKNVLKMLVLATAIGILTTAAFAGMPLICHAFSIGGATSLPWDNSSQSFYATEAGYNVDRLVDDTLALLTPSMPVIVRMETLRRAAIYSEHDPKIAEQLAARLQQRASAAPADALALFDAGYFTETRREASIHSSEDFAKWKREEAKNDGGYSDVLRAISLRDGDAEMEFAAAVICSAGPHARDRAEHLKRAAAEASDGSLLARNLVDYFGNQGQTVADLRASMK